MHVHLDHSGIRRDLDRIEAMVAWRGFALDDDRETLNPRSLLNGRHKVEILFGGLRRRHEKMETTMPGLDAESGARDRCGGLAGAGRTQ